jgi:hypothetical protein
MNGLLVLARTRKAQGERTELRDTSDVRLTRTEFATRVASLHQELGRRFRLRLASPGGVHQGGGFWGPWPLPEAASRASSSSLVLALICSCRVARILARSGPMTMTLVGPVETL